MAKAVIVFTKVKIDDIGADLEWINSIDVSGNIPDFIKNKINTQAANIGL